MLTKLDPSKLQNFLNSKFFGMLLGVTFALSISTNLRWGLGLPVGPGELLLVAMIVLATFLQPWKQLKSPLFGFWVLLWIFTGLGAHFGSVVGTLAAYNSLAYMFTGGITLALLTLFGIMNACQLRRIGIYFIGIVNLGLWVGFFVYIWGDAEILSAMKIYTQDGRYQGWCQNANQMSLLMVPLPFVLLGLWPTNAKLSCFKNVFWVLLLISTVTLGLIVRSDALGFSWILGLAVLWIANGKKIISGPVLKRMLVVTVCFAIGFALVRTASQRGWLVLGNLSSPVSVSSLYKESTGIEALRVGHGESRQKVDIRLQLWKNAIAVWKMSPLVGHGPGAYSNFDMDESHSYSGMEAHNTLIDLGVQGGLLLALAYIGLVIWGLKKLWAVGNYTFFCAALVLFAFEFFMFHLRQPVLWFYLCLLLSLAQAERVKND
jgi:O-antigen ligase